MTLRRSNLEDVLPLSPLQDGLLFHALLATDTSDVYTAQMTVDLDGVLEPSRLEEA